MRRHLLFALLFFVATSALGHGGGLDPRGCHNDRKRGGYHCQGAKQSTSLFAANKVKRKAAFSKVRQRAKRGFAKAQTLLNDNLPYVANCSEARAEGAAPVRRGMPGYSTRLDRDRDGIGCE